MSWTPKEKELVALGISVAAGCRPCTRYHLKAVRKTDSSEEEIHDAIERAASIRRNAADSMERYALGNSADGSKEGGCGGEFDRVAELLSVGAAHAVNCTDALDKHLSAARKGGITEEELQEVFRAAAFIKGKADHHIRKLAEYEEAGAESASEDQAAAASPCCGASDSEAQPSWAAIAK
ncbi:MAG: carboxymuconolactone decarboxylase family protein [Planctomycetota bacterium]|jgi:AhpD family alkylhydroperoxidase